MISPDVFSDVTADTFHIFRRIPIQSSNINDVIRSVSNFLLFFFMIRFHKYKKAQKEYKAPKSTKKYKNTTNLRFINLRFIDLRFINLRFIKNKKCT